MNEQKKPIKGYKVFNPDWTCRGYQYKVGETFTHEGNIEMCGAGFHFCRKASDCFNYYDFNSANKVAEVEAIGNVETQSNKSVTDKLRIVREIPWQELLTIVNTGNDCTGLNNSGNCNTGNCNTGNRNTGNCNTGNRNTGNRNTGNRNTGDWNTGDCNTGNRNTGNRNTGDWNSTSYSTGFFNSAKNPIYMFNKPTTLSRSDILSCRGMEVLKWNFENSWWIYSENMTDEEKKAHPEHETTGGYDNFPSQYGKRVHDCVGLIKGYLWSDTPTAKPKYNGSQDTSANGMLAKCKENGSIATIPDIPGVLVFMDGHVGVYIGNGEVIEARGHEYGVVKTQLKSRPWKWWGKCPWIDYSDSADASQPESVPVKGDTAGKVVKVNCRKLRLKSGTWNVRKQPSADSSVVTTVKGGTDINVADGFVYVPALGGFISEKAFEA